MSGVVNLLPTIAPKSDQLNSDDLIGRSITIKVTKVSLLGEADQPIAVHFEGDDGKPYKPCKSMRRVLVQVWGSDGNAYVGRSMTLYRDERVQFGGQAVGGIRISHMSDIDSDITMALTTTRATRKAFTVRPLRTERAESRRPADEHSREDQGPAPPRQPEPTHSQPELTLRQRADRFLMRLKEAQGVAKLKAVYRAADALMRDLDMGDPELKVECDAAYEARLDELETAEARGQ